MAIVVLENMDAHTCHRLDGHKGNCKFLHGHTYRFDVALESDKLNDMNMVADFGDIKAVIKTWIDDNLDHAFVYDVADKCSQDIAHVLREHNVGTRTFAMRGKPTAENMADRFFFIFNERIEFEFEGSVKLIGLKVWETSKAYAMCGRFTE